MYKNVIKRLIDIIISLMLIPFILILIIPVALFIKLEDHGDVFYNAERYGCNMKKFKMFKFRSMKMNAPDVRNADGTTFNSEKDVRLTKIGGFLRKTSIDELPQIFNVLLGDMSFVGPRPSPMGNENTYTDFIRKKFGVRPGITGYNQALKRNSATLEERYRNDVYYAAAATEAFRAYGIPARYVEGYYLSADQIQKEESGTNTLTGADAHAWVEVYFDGVGWLPLDTTPGYYYDAVSLQQMISAPDQVNKNAVLEDPSFEANQATDTTGSRRNGDALKRVAVRMGAVILGGVTLLIILALVLLGVLEIGRIWDYESMHRKYERVDQKEKIHMMSEKMEKLLEFR